MAKKEKNTLMAMVLGATQNSGTSFTMALAKANYDLILVDKDEDELVFLKHSILSQYSGLNIRVIVEDLGQPESSENVLESFLMYKYFSDQQVSIDVLVNNATVPVDENEIQDLWEKRQELIPIHPATLVDMTEKIGKDMAQNGNGKIFTIMQTGTVPLDSIQDIHESTKHFLEDFSAHVAQRFSQSGVSVCVLFPTDDHQISPLLHTLL